MFVGIKVSIIAGIVRCAATATLLGAPPASLSGKYVFTDDAIEVMVDASAGDVAYELKTITRAGWGPVAKGTVAVRDGKIQVKPLAEGIHILFLKTEPAVELRFLAMAPPPPLDPEALRRSLPRSAEKIIRGESCKILAMGDSVTHTGDFEGMLAMMLARATGNTDITIVDRSYPGRSVDASVRNFQADAVSVRPDLALVMYGLNDQACGASLDGYLEQYEWLATHLAEDCGADTVFLQPTPHIDIPVRTKDASPSSNPPEYAFRTLGFAEAVARLARALKLPCAETFQAIWGDGGKTIEASAEAMWPLYPPSYSDQFSSMLETAGNGDTIHPNALGHLMIAKAVYDAIARPPRPGPLEKSAVSRWTDTGVESTISITNRSDQVMVGTVAVFPRMECGPLTLRGAGEFKLNPGETSEFKVDWPDAVKPEDLLGYPAIACLASGNPILSMAVFSEGKTTVSGVPAPFGTPSFVRERLIVEGPRAEVRLDHGETMAVAWSADQDNGRLPLIRKVPHGWAVAELAFCRYAVASEGEAILDADAGEWGGSTWSRVGEACQARWARGVEDHRTSPAECSLQWSAKAGARGLFLAIRANGLVEADAFTLFFDPRKPEFLGTPGPYYWVSGSRGDDGTFKVAKGETSETAIGLDGKWGKAEDGAFIELFIPYELMDMASWPASGDLGFSLWWMHRGTGGTTHLMWSEDGHPWNTRWYGVIRLGPEARRARPWMIRIK